MRQRDEPGGSASKTGTGAQDAGRAARASYYAQAILLILLAVIVLLLAVANTNRATLHWIVGSTRAPVVWIVVVSALVGWLAGILTAFMFRRRARRRV